MLRMLLLGLAVAVAGMWMGFRNTKGSIIDTGYRVDYRHGLSRDEALAHVRALMASNKSETEDAVPVVFRGALLEWEPVRRWSARGDPGAPGPPSVSPVSDSALDDFARLDGVVEVAAETDGPTTVLYFNEDKPLAAAFARYRRGSPAVVDGVPARHLLDPGARHRRGRRMYYSSKLAEVPAAQRVVGSVLGFQCEHGTSEPNENLWLGTAGVVARSHYDSFHNAFAQLAGRKSFLLHPPSAHRTARLHPRAHPSYRQAQIDPSSEEPFPRRAVRVDLDPGDLLYLPPYHFHQVSALTGSVSTNAWCDSRAFWDLDEALVQPVPMEPHWSRRRTALASREYLAMLHHRIIDNAAVPGDSHAQSSSSDANAAARESFESDPAAARARASQFYADLLVDQRYARLRGGYDAAAAAEPTAAAAEAARRVDASEADAAAVRADMWRGVDAIAPFFDRVNAPLREIHLVNYAEDLVGHFFGHALAPVFFRTHFF